MFEKQVRLSAYVQQQHPEKMSEISIKLADQLMIRLGSNRDLLEIRNIYIFFIMYSFITKDLYLFPRIFTSLDNVQAIFYEALSFFTTKDKSISPLLLTQFNDFYLEQERIFHISKIALSKTLEKKNKLNNAFDDSCHVVAKDYLDDTKD